MHHRLGPSGGQSRGQEGSCWGVLLRAFSECEGRSTRDSSVVLVSRRGEGLDTTVRGICRFCCYPQKAEVRSGRAFEWVIVAFDQLMALEALHLASTCGHQCGEVSTSRPV